ncbi:MAG TPA: ABC transporter ATP-binding protein, partial [Paracoccaceae bacterium]|nr:ABC transporter ATP-binding protein [Paracoccaceae bacterium]
FGLLNITKGRILLEGRDLTNTPPERVVTKGVCYVPQTSNVFVNLSVQENLEMGAFLRRDDIRPRMAEIYAMFPDLAEKRRQPAGSLSGGQRQMVAMGKALMLEPKILLLDEPTAGLSPKYRGEIFQTVRRINAAGVPILMVEQNAKQALGIADRAYLLVDGANRHQGSGRDLLENQEVARMFLGGKE